jgi:DNA-binding MarR family transcriptional regulator
MSSPARTPSSDHGPRLGALLRLCHQRFLEEVVKELADAGYEDLPPSFSSVTQALWDRPAGARLTELAAVARIKKQSMAPIVEELVAQGYVERAVDPTDGRALRIRFTARGSKLARTTRAIVHKIEARWAREVGAEQVETLRRTLQILLLPK